jgi:hypothetical protein
MITTNEPDFSSANVGSSILSVNTVAQPLPTPICYNMSEISEAEAMREQLRQRFGSGESWRQPNLDDFGDDLASFHIAQGLAYTVGSAVGSIAPRIEECLDAFSTLHKNRLTRGARAWTKHAHRSMPSSEALQLAQNNNAPQDIEEDVPRHDQSEQVKEQGRIYKMPDGWWGRPSGPAAQINERALQLFWKIANNTTWKNLHWLPHQVLVYEMRVVQGYGMRWSQDHGNAMRVDIMEDVTDKMEVSFLSYASMVNLMVISCVRNKSSRCR